MNQSSHQAFLNWYEPVHESFVRFCRSRALGVLETEDLVQESILATLEAFNRIKDKEKILSYMIGVAANIVRNKKRKLKFRAQWDERLVNQLESLSPSPEVAADIHFLLKALERLPAKQREAIELFEISGFSIKEVSEIQESSEAATKTRLSRAREKHFENYSKQMIKKLHYPTH